MFCKICKQHFHHCKSCGGIRSAGYGVCCKCWDKMQGDFILERYDRLNEVLQDQQNKEVEAAISKLLDSVSKT